jgi:hypothetical protein
MVIDRKKKTQRLDDDRLYDLTGAGDDAAATPLLARRGFDLVGDWDNATAVAPPAEGRQKT